MSLRSKAHARYTNAAADRGDESRRLSGIYHTHIDENRGGNVPNVPCKRCGYADGGEVHESMQETLARHERERQAAKDNEYEANAQSMRADRPRVLVDDDEKKPRERESDSAMASNYASGGDVGDDGARYITYDQVDDGERVNRRRDGSDVEGRNVPYEYDEERKEKDDYQRVFNNERRGHIAPIHNFSKGGMAKATTSMSFATHLAQKARMKGSPFTSRFKAGR